MVKGKKSQSTKEGIKKSNRARLVQKVIGWPSNTLFKSIIKNKPICNSDINSSDIIDRTDTSFLQVNIVSHSPPHVNIEHIPLTFPISNNHKYIQLYVDFLYVNGVPFLYTRSEVIKLCSIQAYVSISRGQIMKWL